MFEEIAGSSARYVDPMDVAGWGRAIEEAIDDRPQRPRRDPLPDLTRFSWRFERGSDAGFVSPPSWDRS